MASRIYNQFYTGLGQDDFLTGGPKLIDSKSLDGLETGYGVTLGPKVNKLFYSDTALRGLYMFPLTSTVFDNYHLAFGDNGEVYNLNGTDNTPNYTFTSGNRVRGAFSLGAFYYFLVESGAGGDTLDLAQCPRANVQDGTYTGMNETYDVGFVTHFDNPPVLITAQIAYVGGLDVVKNLTSAGVIGTDYTGVNRYVTGLTKHLTQFTMYTSNNEVYYATETAILSGGIQSGSNILDFQPRRAVQSANIDYITTREGDLQVGSAVNTQEVSEDRQTKRLNDNSDFKTIFNFDPGTDVAGNMLAIADGKVYIAANDSTPGIMVYGSVTPGVAKGFHKSITTNSDGDDLEVVYAVAYEHTQDRVYFSYKTATKYGVDYIDLESKETTQLGYGVTEVFSANTAYIKKPTQIRLTTSNTSGSNYVKLYVRNDNGTWELIQTINDDTDVITRHEVKAQYNKNNIDIQFKIELYNDLEDNSGPIVHELLYDYIVTPK